MTAQERQALWFLLALTLLGTGVRVIRSRREHSAATDPAALAGQLAAVDSAIEGEGRRGRKSAKGRGKGARRASQQQAEDPLESISAQPRTSSIAPGRLSATAVPSARLVDLDVASEAEIETLPWVGPSLAERIVRNRETCGAFGSIEALTRVAGVGPTLAERLSSRVTFSAAPRDIASTPPPCRPRR